MTATPNQDAAAAESMRLAEAEAADRATHAEQMQASADATGDVSDSTRSAEASAVDWPS
jgi:hypothetical protein